jgi:hypothetical protein
MCGFGMLLAGAATSRKNSTPEHVILRKLLMTLAGASQELVAERDLAATPLVQATPPRGVGFRISTMLLQSLRNTEQNTLLKQVQ